MIPVGKGESLSPYVVEIYKVIEESGLAYEQHQMGTNVEGEKKGSKGSGLSLTLF